MKKAIIVFVVLAVTAIRPAYAAMIDDFNGGVMTVNADASNVYQQYLAAFGGGRTVNITKTGPLEATAEVNQGTYSHSSDGLTSASSTISWIDESGVDLTSGNINNVFLLAILSIDQGKIDLTLSITDVLGAYDSFSLSGAGVGAQNIAFSLFSNVDFLQVKEVSLLIAGEMASDLEIDSLMTSNTVPAPSVLVLLSVGLLVSGFNRRRLSLS